MNINRIQNCHYQAARHPNLYRVRVRLTVYFGTLMLWLIWALYALSSITAVGLLFTSPFVGVFLLFFATPTAWYLLRFMLTMPTYEPPRGICALESQYPTLYAQMRDIAQKIQQKPAHRIHFIDNVDASLHCQPRWCGWLGMRNTLVLGVPVIAALNQEQLRSVIARQLAFAPFNHLSVTIDKHCTRWRWAQDYLTENRSIFRFIMPHFMAYFDDIVHPLSHQNSFAAERVAAAATSVNAIAQARGNIQLAGDYEREYWQKFWQQTDHVGKPEPMPFQDLIVQLCRLPDYCADLSQRLNQLMQARSTVDDQIPALRDAYEELGVYSRLRWATDKDSALLWLDERLLNLIQQMNQTWWENAADNWQESYDEATQEQNRLIELQNQTEPLSLDESIEQALLTERYRDKAVALPLFYALYQREPSAKHAFHYGRVLLAQNNADGILYLRQCRADTQDRSFAAASWLVEAQYHGENGRNDAANSCEQAFVKQREQDELNQHQRNHIEAFDEFQTARLSDDERQTWQQRFAQIKNVKRVYWVEKADLVQPEQPFYVIVFEMQFTLIASERAEIAEQVSKQLAEQLQTLAHDWILLNPKALPDRTWYRIRQVEKGLLYQKSKHGKNRKLW
ncbi:M48 family metallopeptidase [Kingella kingae]|uniref:M48 family metallopeptidase n=1 Tax=Kingella kingae TaxID=504 RepID=UPI0004214683|nr:M48 family metallopeptidase [Kingella kingae]